MPTLLIRLIMIKATPTIDKLHPLLTFFFGANEMSYDSCPASDVERVAMTLRVKLRTWWVWSSESIDVGTYPVGNISQHLLKGRK